MKKGDKEANYEDSGEIDVSKINLNKFDYTEWRRNLFNNMTNKEYLKEAADFDKNHPFTGKAVRI